MTDHNHHDDDDALDGGLQIITFENEEGETIEFALLIAFELDGQEFAALTPVEEIDRDDVELYVFHTGEDERGRFFEPVEDDDLAQRTFAVAVELLGGTEGED